MEVTLLGTGSSHGVPVLGCGCATCERARERDIERMRFSVHVRNERTDEALLVDASPDLKRQLAQRDVSFPNELLVTHMHFDHHTGLGELDGIVDSLPVHAADDTGISVPDPAAGARSVAEAIEDRYGYANQSVVEHAPLSRFRTCGLDVTLVRVEHGTIPCYGLAVEDPETDAKLAISGDTSYAIPEQSRVALADPDLLVAAAAVPASVHEAVPDGRIDDTGQRPDGDHHDEDGVPRSLFGRQMTREGAIALGEELDAETTRLVHATHYYPVEEAFVEPLATDGERHTV